MSKVKFDLRAGIKVKDKVSGAEGIITSRVQRLNGCLQYVVEPKYNDDGKKIDIFYADFEDLEILDMRGKSKKSETIKFEFETGDKVKNRVHNKTGYITVRRIDPNGCISYWYENGEQSDKGNILEFIGFQQEFVLVDRGLNKPATKAKPQEAPIKRSNTGCRNDLQAPPK